MGTFPWPTPTDHSLGRSGPEGGEEIIWRLLKGVDREHCVEEFGGGLEGICCSVTSHKYGRALQRL